MCPNCVLNQAGLQTGIYVAFGICAIFFVVALAAIMWAFRDGQFDNLEESKFDMLDDTEDGTLAMQWRAKAEKARSVTGVSKG